MSSKEAEPIPMSYTKAVHLLNPLRGFILSPSKQARRLSLHQDSIVMELGCGPGYYSAAVAGYIPNGRLTVVDIQQEMLDMARTRLSADGISNVDYVQADASALPFKDAAFDVVYVIAMLGEVPDKARCICELHRVLRAGGLLSVSEQSYDPHFIPVTMLKSLLGDIFSFERSFGMSRNYTANFRK